MRGRRRRRKSKNTKTSKKNKNKNKDTHRYGLVVRIEGFHPFGPGSIPGIGKMGQRAKPPRGCPGFKRISTQTSVAQLVERGPFI